MHGRNTQTLNEIKSFNQRKQLSFMTLTTGQGHQKLARNLQLNGGLIITMQGLKDARMREGLCWAYLELVRAEELESIWPSPAGTAPTRKVVNFDLELHMKNNAVKETFHFI